MCRLALDPALGALLSDSDLIRAFIALAMTVLWLFGSVPETELTELIFWDSMTLMPLSFDLRAACDTSVVAIVCFRLFKWVTEDKSTVTAEWLWALLATLVPMIGSVSFRLKGKSIVDCFVDANSTFCRACKTDHQADKVNSKRHVQLPLVGYRPWAGWWIVRLAQAVGEAWLASIGRVGGVLNRLDGSGYHDSHSRAEDLSGSLIGALVNSLIRSRRTHLQVSDVTLLS